MYNNYNNDNFNNNPKPLFSNIVPEVEINNNIENNQNSFVNAGQDVPPVLEPIKNLNDVNIVSAPTLDVLGPMNIMPESFDNKDSVKVDALDAYDNGVNYGAATTAPVNNDLYNPISSLGEMQKMGNNFVPSEISTKISSEENNFVQNPVSFNATYVENNIKTNSTSFENPSLENYDNDIFNSSAFEPKNLVINEFNSGDSEDKNALYTNPLDDENPIDNFSSKPTMDFNSEEKSSKEHENESKSYEIKQDKIEHENSMLNLGIDSMYDDIDMLDIVDIDEEKKEDSNNIEEQENIEEEKETEEKPLIVDNINEIKELIKKIKEKGVKIELEEFDFEDMYQLIVKIEK